MMNKILFLLLFPSYLFAQNIFPAPKIINKLEGNFNIAKDNLLIKSNSSNTRYLIKELKDLNINSSSTSNSLFDILLEKIESKTAQNEILQLGNEGYTLTIDNSKIEIKALTDAGIYYGIQTLKQIINGNKILPNLKIVDKPDIAIRAWQDDISRGPIPTMEFFKKEIEMMASFKLNYFTLYIEHVFKLKKHPTIAPDDGITTEQLKELEEFAAKHFVTLIGSYQSFGHMAKTLSIPGYSHLAENGHIISPALAESYQFLEDVFSEIAPAFNGNFFNINCDETFGLGEGKSKSLVDSIGLAGVYTYHINKLDKMLKKYDKKILMWGDIAAKYPEIVSSLPKDITVIPWAYQDADNFDFAIKPISNQGLNFWIAPGVSCWANIFPNLQNAENNIYKFIRDGYKLNATGVLNTSWDDGGLNFFNNNWHGFAWGAENSWNAPVTETNKEDRFRKFNIAFNNYIFGTSNKIVDLFLEFSELHKSGIRNELKSDRFFESIFPIYLEYVKNGKLVENTKDIEKIKAIKNKLESLKPSVTKNKDLLDYFEFALDQVLLTLNKNIFRIELYAYINGENNFKKAELKNKKQRLINEIEILKNRYIQLWNQENRNYWLENNIKKFDDLIKNLKQLDGHIIIEPLNEITKKGRAIKIRSVFNEVPIQYEINKNTISENSSFYKAPIYSKKNISIIAKTEGDYIPEQLNLIFHKGIGSFYKLNTNYSLYHPSYSGGGKYALVDGQEGSKDDYKSGKWQAYSGEDINIELAFPKRKKLKSFSMGFFQNTESWVIFPKQVEIYIKNKENAEYQLFKIIKGKIPPEAKGSLKEKYATSLDNIKPAFIKVIARCYGKLPEWHNAGSTYDSMLFADEIIIE